MKVTRSVKRATAAGERTFPSLDDLVQPLIDNGIVRDTEDLFANHPEELSDLLFAWIRSGQTGCVFALKLAKMEEAGWDSIVIRNAISFDDFYDNLQPALIHSARAHEAVTLIFPEVRTARDVVLLVNRLCQQPDWCWSDDKSKNKDEVLISLRWSLPPPSDLRTAVLGFAPIETMPFTRRSPVTALVFRVGGFGRYKTLIEKQSSDDLGSTLHLADMTMHLDDDRAGTVDIATKKEKAILLDGELVHAAKANVTFRLDASLRGELCPPEIA